LFAVRIWKFDEISFELENDVRHLTLAAVAADVRLLFHFATFVIGKELVAKYFLRRNEAVVTINFVQLILCQLQTHIHTHKSET